MLRAIKKTRIHEEVFSQIQALIKEGRFKARDQLPSERELAEIFKVSRTSVREALRAFPKIEGRRLVHETVRRMINTLVTDLIRQSAADIRKAAPESTDEVRRAPAMIRFSERIQREQVELKQFLRVNLYRHYHVSRMSAKARRIITELFQAFMTEPGLLPPEFQARSRTDTARAIADYIAGMTDRYAIAEHQRLFAIDVS